MLSNIQKNIIERAVRIRVENGEDAKAILKSYSKLTDEERTEIADSIANFL